MPLVAIDYDFGLPGLEIASGVASALGVRLVSALPGPPELAITQRALSRLQEAMLRLAEASAGQEYLGVGPAAAPPNRTLMGELERAAAGPELVVSACHFAAETMSPNVGAVNIFVTASLRLRVERVAGEGLVESERAREILVIADRTARAYRAPFGHGGYPDSRHHQLIVDTSGMSDAGPVELIVSYLRLSEIAPS